ncbi:MAG: tRNA uridine-5-carboxymethylaminomethyl(34) synthesis GTPase MnmE [Bacteroidales bacterium]|nr:tRNA uridine-5-carboxymethylaminomethyl(34) synthesis GTPase MnmE [Bacteroidales bacterium]
MLNEDTICAISTSGGSGAIAMIRISGKDAVRLADQLVRFPGEGKRLADQKGNTLHYAEIMDQGKLLDEVILSLYKAPRSYTGEDLVEISCHGSVVIQQKIMELLIRAGAVVARPGEFTQRAFLNGKMDLSQAEGVADLIASGSAAAHRLAINQMRGGFSAEIKKLRSELLEFISLIELELDFSEEDVEFADRGKLNSLTERIISLLDKLISSFEYGNAMKNGVPVAIVGPTNSGKSTLLNRLLQDDKAIVSDIAGTTRDSIEDTIVIGGVQFRFIDTAGLRHTEDKIETEGIQRSLKKYEQASIVILMIGPLEDDYAIRQSLAFLDEKKKAMPKKSLILALNKADLLDPTDKNRKLEHIRTILPEGDHYLALSARDGEGIGELENILLQEANKGHSEEQDVVVTNLRHFEALSHAREALARAREGLASSLPTDLLAQDIREALHYLGEITGEITTDNILSNIFDNFCIGK